MDPLLKLLQQLRRLEPGEHFSKVSLPVIVSAPQKRGTPFFTKCVEIFQYSGAVMLASLLLFVMLGGLSLVNRPGVTAPALASLDSNNLNAELTQLNLQIQLSVAQYYESSSKTVSSALDETASNIPGHLNTAIIEKELGALEQIASSTKDLEDLLETLTE